EVGIRLHAAGRRMEVGHVHRARGVPRRVLGDAPHVDVSEALREQLLGPFEAHAFDLGGHRQKVCTKSPLRSLGSNQVLLGGMTWPTSLTSITSCISVAWR